MGAFGDVAGGGGPRSAPGAAAATQISPNSADTTPPCREKVVGFTAGVPASRASRHGGEGTRRSLAGDGAAWPPRQFAGPGPEHADPQTRPQDDLFGHVNGRWLTEYVIPADRATDGAFRSFDRAEEQVRDLITEAAAGAPPVGTDQRASATRTPASRRGHGAVTRYATPRDELALIDAAADAGRPWRGWWGNCSAPAGGGAGVYVDTDSSDSTRYLRT